jgi:chromosomal replication initiator protein
MLAWETFLKTQDEEIGKETTTQWLRSLKVVDFDACNLYLEARDSLQALWFEEHMRPKIKGRLYNNNHRLVRVHLTVADTSSLSSTHKKGEKKGSEPIMALSLFQQDSLDPSYTLDNFITTPDNHLSIHVLKELSTLKTSAFNPIYLYGGCGVGKTHLLMAIANAFKAHSALFVRAETFTEHVVSAIRNGAMREFRKSYRNIDLLLIDDVHILARRAATQEELFHTFNTLHTARKQIIFSANLPPTQLSDIESRLISRFEWGITLHVAGLSIDGLRELLIQKMELLNFFLPEEMQQFLIEKFQTSSKALVRSLEALALRSHLEGIPPHHITLERALNYLKELLEEEQGLSLTPLKIIRSIADFYGILPEDILGKSHSREYSLPRQLAMYFCRQKLRLSLPKIASLFFRDHSTVITSIRNIQKKIDGEDRDLALTYAELLKKF